MRRQRRWLRLRLLRGGNCRRKDGQLVVQVVRFCCSAHSRRLMLVLCVSRGRERASEREEEEEQLQQRLTTKDSGPLTFCYSEPRGGGSSPVLACLPSRLARVKQSGECLDQPPVAARGKSGYSRCWTEGC